MKRDVLVQKTAYRTAHTLQTHTHVRGKLSFGVITSAVESVFFIGGGGY